MSQQRLRACRAGAWSSFVLRWTALVGLVPLVALSAAACGASDEAVDGVDLGRPDGSATDPLDGAVQRDGSPSDSDASGGGYAQVFPPLLEDASLLDGALSSGPLDGGATVSDDPGRCPSAGMPLSLSTGLGICEAPFEVDLTGMSQGEAVVVEVGEVLSGAGPAVLGPCAEGARSYVAFVITVPEGQGLQASVSSGVVAKDLVLLTQSGAASGCADQPATACVDSFGAGECETLRLDPQRLVGGRVRLFVGSFSPAAAPFVLHLALDVAKTGGLASLGRNAQGADGTSRT